MQGLPFWRRRAQDLSSKYPLTILCYDEGGQRVAHCLEMDLVCAGASRDDAIQDMKDVIRAHVRYAVEQGNLEHLFKPAPEEYWTRLGTATVLGVIDLDFELPADPTGRSLFTRQFQLRELAACA